MQRIKLTAMKFPKGTTAPRKFHGTADEAASYGEAASDGEAKKKKAASYGGVKMPRKGNMTVWGTKAHAACRVMLMKAAKRYEERFPQMAAKAYKLALKRVKGEPENAKVCDALTAWKDGKTTEEEDAVLHIARHYADVEDDRAGKWIVTLVRNRLHICVWQMKGKLELHPWARFLGWYMQRYGKAEDVWELGPDQLVVRDGYTLQFKKTEEGSGAHKVWLRVSGKEHVYDLYPRGEMSWEELQEKSNAELCRLEKRVMALEKGSNAL